ncbi:HAD family hydrolase [Aurantiacibacter hainanensis]|uniref:HAD family hydrolase n=1 Tax=Aurantiacibacter hainanensis TaxID=3076114 RepID=UPI0030C6A4A1
MIEIEAEVLVFDLDDTLYLERDFAESGYRSIARHFGDEVGGDLFASECRSLLAKGTRGNIFDLALSRCRIESTPELIDTLVRHYRTHSPEIAFCEDVSRFFDRGVDMPTGLITDGPKEGQRAKIAALGLDRTIDHVVVTGEWSKEFSKPHPRAFELIESLTSSSKHNLVYIADNAAKDFIGPRQLGWQTVQIVRSGRIHDGSPAKPGHEADHVVTSFDELQIRSRA